MKLKFMSLWMLLWGLMAVLASAQNNVNIRVMTANLNGDTQSYQPFALRILQGLKPDIVAIQEFNYTSTNGLGANTPAAMREMVDAAFGTNFDYYREPLTGSGDIPNGIISRYPILNAGSWTDELVANRGFAWARIDLPGTNDFYVVSVHLLTSSAANRSIESTNLKALIQANFPAGAWIVVAGDFNTGSRTESTTMITFGSYVSDYPIPVDNVGNSDTSGGRNHPHDYVLPSFSLTNYETATVLPSHAFPSGLVFDSAVYTPLSDVSPVQYADSGQAQHMAVMKDFSIPVTDDVSTNPPVIVTAPEGQTNGVGADITFSAKAFGANPLSYQWQFNGTNIVDATTSNLTISNAQLTNSGNYSVTVTNFVGSVTSSVATLLITNASPSIVSQPQDQVVLTGQTAFFTAAAIGTLPLKFQWRLNGDGITGAITNPLVLQNVQPVMSGSYSVVITNNFGSITSEVATLTVLASNSPVVLAQWNFNSPTPDGNVSSGSVEPSVGSGIASPLGGVVDSFVGGDSSLDPAGGNDNSAWTTTGYPASTANNKSAGVQFAVSTAGKQNITVTWSQRSSNTGSRYFRLQYSTNNGASFEDYPTSAVIGTSFTAVTNNLISAPEVNNNSNFVFRIVSEFESTATGTGNAAYAAANAPSSSYASTGTSRFDMVTVLGSPIASTMPATLTAQINTNGQFIFQVSGSPGASYIVQTSTNLTGGNWVSIFTNSAPFTFGETNIPSGQKFYRVAAQ